MEKYEKSTRRQPMAQPAQQENEVRVIGSGRLRVYVDQAVDLLQGSDTTVQHQSILIKAMGRAINKVVALVEVVKRRVPNLHQITEISTIPITDTWEPKEEGLAALNVTRNVSAIQVLLATGGLDERHPGYQAPLNASEVVPVGEEELEDMERGDMAGGRGRGRGRGRGGRGRGREAGESAVGEHTGNGGVQDAFAGMAIGEGGAEGGEGGEGRTRGRGRGSRRGRGRRSGRGRAGQGGEGGGDGGGDGPPPSAGEAY